MMNKLSGIAACLLLLSAGVAFSDGTNLTNSISVTTNALAPTSAPLTLIIGGEKYENVRFGQTTPSTVKIFHSSGIMTVPIVKLPPEIQKQLGYDPQVAAQYQNAVQKQQASQRQAEYESLLKRAKQWDIWIKSVSGGVIIGTGQEDGTQAGMASRVRVGSVGRMPVTQRVVTSYRPSQDVVLTGYTRTTQNGQRLSIMAVDSGSDSQNNRKLLYVKDAAGPLPPLNQPAMGQDDGE